MKHKMGNLPKCSDCFWYSEKEPHDGCRLDGWCSNEYQRTVGVNGHKREKPLERYEVARNHACRRWEDAESRLTHFEVMTRQPEEWRSAGEKEYITQLLGGIRIFQTE